MPAIKYYKVTLTEEEKLTVEQYIRKGKTSSRSHTRARILLKAAACWQDKAIMEDLGVSASMIYKTRQRCVEAGPEAALKDYPRPGKVSIFRRHLCIDNVRTNRLYRVHNF